MKYTITAKRKIESTLFTTVQYDFGVITEVAHSRPKSLEEIQQNILNRSITEQAALVDITDTEALFNQIVLNQEVTVE